ncbi:MAG: 5-formyltetrahydrofolate cyclo-ligase [Verrucomicrobia bacterium]|nr:5-formyltetrahydrofolate cyclo-ligase [Verrucomicrobiota bacterium]
MNDETKNLKSRIRSRVRAELDRISPDERWRASKQASELLQLQSIWKNATSVLFYAPLPDELDLSPLWKEAISQGKRLALPRFHREAWEYVACQLADPTRRLAIGRFGLLEPPADSPRVALKQLDLVLVPGVAFDLSGRRLGRGRGYFDRLLAKVSGTKCGVAFEQQIQAELPLEPHDVPVDCILTPERWFCCGQRPAMK